MPRAIEKVKSERAIFAWYLFDEPDLHKLPPERYHRLARQLRAADSRRPIFLTVWSPKRYQDFVQACDIFAPNPYVITRLDPHKNDLRAVGRSVDAARAAAGRRPVWAILQAFWAEPIWPRNPTPEELRAMAFIALNHGADGIIYFSYKSGGRPITQHGELFESIRQLNGQLRALRGVLLVRPKKGALRQEPVTKEAEQETAGSEAPSPAPLDCSVRRFSGGRLLIAVNPNPESREVRLFLSGDGATSIACELFTDAPADPITAAAGEPLTLSFKPHETRIFWIE